MNLFQFLTMVEKKNFDELFINFIDSANKNFKEKKSPFTENKISKWMFVRAYLNEFKSLRSYGNCHLNLKMCKSESEYLRVELILPSNARFISCVFFNNVEADIRDFNIINLLALGSSFFESDDGKKIRKI